MSWEAFRLSSRSHSELVTVMGPAGVDALVRDCLMECWKSLPEEKRDMPAWRKRVGEVWNRNLRVWSAIKKPTPEAFFQNLLPFASDGHLRQALVLCHMMLPRGKRAIGDVRKIVAGVFERNVEAWEKDFRVFTQRVSRRVPKSAKPKASAAKVVAKPRIAGKNATGENATGKKATGKKAPAKPKKR